MACTIELPKDDLKAAIESYARINYRAARNNSNPAIAKIYEDLAKHYSDSLQTIIQTSTPIKK